jgi:NAD(P)-dependent dehydrogenase (short-subunit alcohol dehydrogenase family)
VIVADLDLATAKETAARLCREGHRALAGHVDVTEETSVEALGDVTVRLGKLVGWVNNAGISEVIPLTDMSVEAWDRMMSVNVRGVFLGTRAAARRMESGGAIVNLASVSSVIAFPHRCHYGASKGAVVAFTKHAAIDLAPRGIRVNAVGPGTIESQMTRGRLSDPEQLRWTCTCRSSWPAGRYWQRRGVLVQPGCSLHHRCRADVRWRLDRCCLNLIRFCSI